MPSRQDIFSILITFCVGLVAGMYVYLVGFMPKVTEFQDYIASPEETLTIVGEMYGDFGSMSAPAFYLTADGSYRFLPGSPETALPQPQTGTLPRGWRTALQPQLQTSILVRAATPRADQCNDADRTTWYRYQITMGTTRYELDSCTTALAEEPALAAALANLWNYFLIQP